MKTVDKFGRYRGFLNRPGPPGIGFHLTEDGQYDIQNKILRNVGEGKNGHDAVNCEMLQKEISQFPTLNVQEKEYDFQYRRLSNVGTPLTINDGTNLQSVHDAIITHEYWIQREMADLLAFVRKEIYHVHREDKKTIEAHLKKIDKKLGRTWREVANIKTVADQFTKEDKEDIKYKIKGWSHFTPSNLI